MTYNNQIGNATVVIGIGQFRDSSYSHSLAWHPFYPQPQTWGPSLDKTYPNIYPDTNMKTDLGLKY